MRTSFAVSKKHDPQNEWADQQSTVSDEVIHIL